MCETDFSGYPDCRDDTLKALQVAVSLGMGQRFTIETPRMWLDKAQTWIWLAPLGGDALVDIVLEQSHTCYHGCAKSATPGATAAAPALHALCARLDLSDGMPAQAR